MKTGKVLPAVFLFLISAANVFAISWRSDLSSAISEAKSSGKPVMVDFYTDWCGWCKKLDSDTYSDSTVGKLAAQFICVKIDADRHKEIASKYNVRGYPTIIFLNSDGSAGERIGGYLPPAQFADAMKRVLQKAAGRPAQKTGTVSGEKARPADTEVKTKAEVKPAPKKTADGKTMIEKASDKIEAILNGGFELSGIIYDTKSPEAIINNTLVKTGDLIDGAKVTAIEETRVKLTIDGRDIVLRLQR